LLGSPTAHVMMLAMSPAATTTAATVTGALSMVTGKTHSSATLAPGKMLRSVVTMTAWRSSTATTSPKM
jgi:hypothetical protein